MNLQFHYIEKLWQSFWSPKTPSSDGSTALPARYTAFCDSVVLCCALVISECSIFLVVFHLLKMH